MDDELMAAARRYAAVISGKPNAYGQYCDEQGRASHWLYLEMVKKFGTDETWNATTKAMEEQNARRREEADRRAAEARSGYYTPRAQPD